MAMGLALLAVALVATGPVAAQPSPSAAEAGPDGDAAAPASILRIANYCGVLASAPWPGTAPARRALLQRLEALRQPCIGHAGFLAALGALWMEQGEPAQALLWLERSLLLDPAQPGALADHALALAALGEGAALDALIQEWAHRTDIPPALRQRLAMASAAGNAKGRMAAVPAEVRPPDGWVSYREASLTGGYETNLNHSPRLAELTITWPEGTRREQLLTPFEPRRGGAMTTDLAWQLARSPAAGAVFQTGLQVTARHAPGETSTDWHLTQWAASASQRWGAWRVRGQGHLTWIGGNLNEPYRLSRLGLSVDREAIGCNHRFTLEGERRTQRSTRTADGQATGIVWSSLCPWRGGSGDWAAGLAVRASADDPITSNRPGGRQHHQSLGFRVLGTLGASTRFDATLRASRVKDSEGYSPLLENNAVRRLHQTQFTLELSRTLRWSWLPGGAEALIQLQGVRQSSNLELFSYSGLSTYGGIRWRW